VKGLLDQSTTCEASGNGGSLFTLEAARSATRLQLLISLHETIGELRSVSGLPQTDLASNIAMRIARDLLHEGEDLNSLVETCKLCCRLFQLIDEGVAVEYAAAYTAQRLTVTLFN